MTVSRWKWGRALRDDQQVQRFRLLVLLTLATHYYPDHQHYSATVDDLAEETGVRVQRVRDELKWACDAGYLFRKFVGRKGRASEYELRVPALSQPSTVCTSEPIVQPSTVGTPNQEFQPSTSDFSAVHFASHSRPDGGRPVVVLTEVSSTQEREPVDNVDVNALFKAIAPRRPTVEILNDLKAAGIHAPARWAAKVPRDQVRTKARTGYLARASDNSTWDTGYLADAGTPYDREDTEGWDI